MKKIIFIIAFFGWVSSLLAAVPREPKTFDSPNQAAQALTEAAVSENKTELTALLGDTFVTNVRSGDAEADHFHLQKFAKKMQESQQLVEGPNGTQIIKVGPDGWPFPAPLVRSHGRWHFDGATGAEEIINRRIGENELRAIKILQFYVDAQRLYHSLPRTEKGSNYAQRLISTPGTKDGLYWPEEQGLASPFGPLVGRAIAEGYKVGKTSPTGVYQGYHYRILTKQGAQAQGGAKSYINKAGQMTEGFAMIAYPVRWGVSGVMSFIVGTDGKVYEKDLGKNTETVAAKIFTFDPDSSWSEVKEGA